VILLLIKNARIMTFDDENTFIEEGYIKIKDGIISDIGESTVLKDGNSKFMDSERYLKGEKVIDAKGKLIMPGFICTHTHIYSAFARGMDLKGGSTADFLEILENLWWRLDKKLTHEDIYYSALVTLIESIKNGVTCLFDHHAGPNSVEGSLDIIEKAFRELGVRGALCYEVSDRDGEDIALKGIEENIRFINKCHGNKDDMIKGLFGLHASFTLSDKTLKEASSRGNAAGAGFHIHVAEGPQDLEYNKKHFNKGVVERLEEFSIINERSILAHCIHVSSSEKDLLRKGIVVHNPESNMNNAVGYCDAADLTNRGVLVGLGSDGFSANPFRAMDACYVLHKHEKENPNAMTPKDVIQMAIKNNGSIASRYFKEPIGVIKKGAKADIIFLDYNSPTPINKDNLEGHIIFGMNSNLITHSIIDGKLVMKDRRIVNIEELEIYKASRKLAKSLWDRF